MVTVWPAMVRVPLRGDIEKLLDMMKDTVPDPVPVPPEKMLIQSTLLAALQLQVLEEALTVKFSV